MDAKQLYMIIDQIGLDFSIIPALNVLSIQWCSLWQGLPEESAENEAPLLIKIDINNLQQRQWIEGVCQEAAPKHAVIAFCSMWTMATLINWFQGCIDAAHESQSGLLRFYDPRLFLLLTDDILNKQQAQQLNRPALFWSWMDRDRKENYSVGNGKPLLSGEKTVLIDLTDKQFESIMCVCDVNMTSAYMLYSNPNNMSNEDVFSHFYRGMREASDKGVFIIEDREALALKKMEAALL